MKELVLVLSVGLCVSPAAVLTQQKPAVGDATRKPAAARTTPRNPASAAQEIVREWFRRWNALDGSDAATARLIDLYLPRAIHQTEPSARQIGPVYYEGHEAIRKLAADFTKAAEQSAFAIDKTTAGPSQAEMFFMSEGPWGGPGIGVQYTGRYIDRTTKQRRSFPGFAVFHIENGKIRYARFYTTRDENRAE